jgi:hypothetical protein
VSSSAPRARSSTSASPDARALADRAVTRPFAARSLAPSSSLPPTGSRVAGSW